MPTPANTRFFLPTRKLEAIPLICGKPEEDHLLSVQFGARSLGKRKENKRYLLAKYAVSKEALKKPLVCVVASLFTTPSEKMILEEVITGLGELDVYILVIAQRRLCSDALLSRCLHLENNEVNLHQALAASDIVVFPPTVNSNILSAAFDYGTIPVASSGETGVKDYDPTLESGNSFAYTRENSWSVFASIVRALETFKLPYDWQRIQRNGMGG